MFYITTAERAGGTDQVRSCPRDFPRWEREAPRSHPPKGPVVPEKIVCRNGRIAEDGVKEGSLHSKPVSSRKEAMSGSPNSIGSSPGAVEPRESQSSLRSRRRDCKDYKPTFSIGKTPRGLPDPQRPIIPKGRGKGREEGGRGGDQRPPPVIGGEGGKVSPPQGNEERPRQVPPDDQQRRLEGGVRGWKEGRGVGQSDPTRGRATRPDPHRKGKKD